MSKQFSLGNEDVKKSAEVFLWSAGSLLTTVVLAVVAMPVEDLPNWLLFLVPLTPLINTVAYAVKKWAEDSR